MSIGPVPDALKGDRASFMWFEAIRRAITAQFKTLRSVRTGITATGTTQADATELEAEINEVTTVATGAGVRLKEAVPGNFITVRNSDAADALKVYPAVGGQINALGTDTALSVAAGATVRLEAVSTTQWFS